MTLTRLAKQTEKLVRDNSPTLLTAIGVTGTITTAYLTGKASFKAADLLRSETDRFYGDPEVELHPKTKILLTWKLYIPAISVGTMTIVCIVGANRIGTRRTAAMAAAYSISDRAFAEYKDKVVEKLGEKQEQAVRDEIAQDQIDRNPPPQSVAYIGQDEVLFYEPYTGRYFGSTVETLKKAQNDTNYQIIHNGYASLSDFYSNAGIPTTSISDELGWRSDKLMELTFSTTKTEGGIPCMSFEYQVEPIRNFYKVH